MPAPLEDLAWPSACTAGVVSIAAACGAGGGRQLCAAAGGGGPRRRALRGPEPAVGLRRGLRVSLRAICCCAFMLAIMEKLIE